MRIEPLPGSNIAEGDSVELSGITSPCSIHGEKNRPGQAAANSTDKNDHTEIPQEEICLQRRMPQDKLVIEDSEVVEPGQIGATR